MIRRSGCGCGLIFLLQAAAYSPALLRLVTPHHNYLAARTPTIEMTDGVDLPAKGPKRRKRAKATNADAPEPPERSAKDTARRNAGEAPIAWYLRTIGNHELLAAEEELELSTLVQRMLAVRAKGTQMEEDLGRPPRQSELAAALSLGTPPPPPPTPLPSLLPHPLRVAAPRPTPKQKPVASPAPSPVPDLRPPLAQAPTLPRTLTKPDDACQVRRSSSCCSSAARWREIGLWCATCGWW